MAQSNFLLDVAFNLQWCRCCLPFKNAPIWQLNSAIGPISDPFPYLSCKRAVQTQVYFLAQSCPAHTLDYMSRCALQVCRPCCAEVIWEKPSWLIRIGLDWKRLLTSGMMRISIIKDIHLLKRIPGHFKRKFMCVTWIKVMLPIAITLKLKPFSGFMSLVF